MDPITTAVGGAAASGAAKELVKEVAKHIAEAHVPGEVCVDKKVAGTSASVRVCVTPEEVCAIVPHPRTGLPVKACVSSKVTRADAAEIAEDISKSLAARLRKALGASEE